MAFATAGSSGGNPPTEADGMLRLLEIMTDPKAAKEYLLKIKAEREANQTILQGITEERAAFVQEKGAFEARMTEEQKALAERESFLKKSKENWERAMNEQRTEADRRETQAAKALAEAEALKKDYERRLAKIREAAV